MSPVDLCPLCGADPTAVEALRARVAEVERERDGTTFRHFCIGPASAKGTGAFTWACICGAGPDCYSADRITDGWGDGCPAALRAALAKARRERDARPDPGALLAALDAIRAAAATGARPAELARMIEDVQAGCIRPPTGDGELLGERSCFTCRHNVEVGPWENDCALLGSGPITAPIDLRTAIGGYTTVSGAATADDRMPTNRSIRCLGWAAKEPK